MSTPHKHAAVIKAWADGAKIEYLGISGNWTLTSYPRWIEHLNFIDTYLESR